jgi:hypothetical protein
MTKYATPLGRLAARPAALVSAVAVVVIGTTLAVDQVRVTGTSPATQPSAQHAVNSSYDNGEGVATPLTPSTRFDGGPEEGTRGTAAPQTPSTRFDGGPEEGTRGGRR